MEENQKKIDKNQIKAHVIRHAEFEGIGNIGQYFKLNNIEYTETKLFNEEELPEIEGFDLLVVMGGPMGIYDDKEYPFLVEERVFISKVINKGIKVIGICLGAQLLANSLGGEVMTGPYKEIGWFCVDFSPEFYEWMMINSEKDASQLMDCKVFQWHGDTFTNPKESINIGMSKPMINQGFIYNNQVIALQFHIEMTKSTVQSIVENGLDEINDHTVEHSYIQSEKIIMNEKAYFKKNNEFLVQLLDTFLML